MVVEENVSRVSEKGQVTIPKPLRKIFGLGKEQLVVFVQTEVGVLVLPAKVEPEFKVAEKVLKLERKARKQIFKEKYGRED